MKEEKESKSPLSKASSNFVANLLNDYGIQEIDMVSVIYRT
jgi:hypothetical protein